jgi:hypothetical protein
MIWLFILILLVKLGKVSCFECDEKERTESAYVCPQCEKPILGSSKLAYKKPYHVECIRYEGRRRYEREEVNEKVLMLIF